MGKALNDTGRVIAYSCSWPAYDEFSGVKPNYGAIADACNLWRNWDDINDSWESVYSIIKWFGDNQDRLSPYHGPGHWNDPDMVRRSDLLVSETGFSSRLAGDRQFWTESRPVSSTNGFLGHYGCAVGFIG